ncbi:MAG: triacylglycerol lipase [Oscillospiraceae bacterium]|nr:triacylglycerol lipase [Oscillospiraceae bacterium]
MFLIILLWIGAAMALLLDIFDKLPIENAVGRFIGMTILPHIAMLAWYSGTAAYNREQWGGLGFIVGIIAPLCIFALYFMARLAVKPYRINFDKTEVNVRVRAMYGGKILLKYTAISLLCNTVYYIFAIKNNFWGIDKPLWITDTVISAVIILGYGWNGILRIVLLCRRLGIVKRVVYFFLLPVPIVGIFVLISMYRTAKAEYDYETTRKACENQRIESQVCKTKYPILLVHGLGFRDWRYFNYWGRIPRELIRNGATIFYGHQEACATVVTNAEHIRRKVLEIVEETGCEKVNIIAHSKGGLDSRYAIAKLGIEDYVATLTTVGTPHHGSQVTDLANKLPDSFYRKVADFMDKRFKKLGDENPDFYTACHQFNSDYAEQFNKEITDSEKVYYQSYTSVMKNAFSFDILGFTWLLLSRYGRNDGLVTEESAKWGNFKGVYESKRVRGISHGDTIDLKREDYKGYDPREAYVEIVSELKEMGY